MRALEIAGLVQLDGGGADVVPEAAQERVPESAPPRAPAAPADANAPAMAVTEQRPFDDIYAEQAVPVTPFTAEKLLKILDGLAALEPASRKAAVLALDAADDAWSIDDALADGQIKIKALRAAKLQAEDQAREALAQARARIEDTEQRQVEAVGTIRKQIADLEALLEREVTRATERKGLLANAAQAAKEACQRETTRLDAEVVRLGSIDGIFGAAGGQAPSGRAPQVTGAR